MSLENRDLVSNHLLSSIPPYEYERLASHLRLVKLRLGDAIFDGDERMTYAYFPTTSVLSLTSSMENGASAEIAVMGNDGVWGLSLVLGGCRTTNCAHVCIAGEALRIEARVLRGEFARCPDFQKVLLRYTDSLISQISLTAACNCSHPLKKRFCRWLLLIQDRALTDELVMTQESIAHLLGGRRETVTVAAGQLQDLGIIHYTRGRIRVVNRDRLENAACECYRAVTGEYRWMTSLEKAGQVKPNTVQTGVVA